MWALTASALVAVGLGLLAPRPTHARRDWRPAGAGDGRHRPSGVATRTGRWIRHRARLPLGPESDRAVGMSVVATALVAALVGPVVVVVPLVVVVVAVVTRRRRARARLAATAASVPEAVDLLRLAIGSGLNVRLAVGAVGRLGPEPLAAELRRAEREAASGRALADALAAIPERLGDSTRSAVAALVSSERYGAPLGSALERLGAEARVRRRREAEIAARRLPVKLLFPLVAGVLPAFGLLTLGPLVVVSVRDLSW